MTRVLPFYTKPCYFYCQKRSTVLKVTKEFKHHSKTNCGPFWKVTLPGGELEKPFEKIGSQETFTKLRTLGAVPCSSELLGRGMMVRDGEC